MLVVALGLSACSVLDSTSRYLTEHNLRGVRVCNASLEASAADAQETACLLGPSNDHDGVIPDDQKSRTEEIAL